MKYLFYILLLTSCTPTLYLVATDTNIETFENRSYTPKLIYLDQQFNSQGKLTEIADYINRGKWKRVDEQIHLFENNQQIFLRSIKNMNKEEYLSAYRSLDSLTNTSQHCQVALLKTDCLYALRVDSIDVKNRYQKAMDCTDHDIVKSIVKTRYKFLRYAQ